MDRLKEINDAYLSEKRKKLSIEKATVKAKAYAAAKRLFRLAEGVSYVRRGDGYIDVLLCGDRSGVFTDLFTRTNFFKRSGELVYQHRLCKNVFIYNHFNMIGGVNFARIIFN
ncbi:hypothetical protein [Morganella morganii]|uniref:hypothetical protein n=1 Tax=Morganella morganii TaxID=582 RepID=UPI00052BF1AB|nr:hypothetical protein [Morganella morganii]KGP42304.1 hypothetical protein LR61_19395 [Morganella morganii]